MVILVDADVIIRGEKETFDLKDWVASRSDDAFAIAAITIAELWHGVERDIEPRKSNRRRYLEGVTSGLQIFPYTAETAYEHARIWADLQSAGKMIGAYDLIVAATALELGSHVATFNKKHFAMVKGLRIIEPE